MPQCLSYDGTPRYTRRVDTPPSTLAESLARFIHTLEPAAIPDAIRDKARLHLLDSIGIALAASTQDYARKAFAGLGTLEKGESIVIGMPGRLTLRDSALMNGMLVHGLEFDDTSVEGRIHPSAFAVPCALAAGAFTHASGAALLAAYIGGVECAIRLGAAARGGFSPAGFNAMSVVGAFGSALIAGKLLGLDAQAITNAQGIAYSAAAGNREFSASAAWTKRFEAGWPAASGITAAALAGQGFIGPRTAYEGKYGVFNTYLNEPAAPGALEPVTRGLGDEWKFADTLVKLRPSCFFNHPAINSTLALVTEHRIAASDIRRIRVLLPRAAIDTVCEPREAKLAPQDIAAAQFSVYFSVACAVVRKQFTLDEMNEATLTDPLIRALAARVEYAVDAQSTFPLHYSGGVEITTIDGRTLSAREDANAGSRDRPLAAGAIEKKFRENAQRVLPKARVEEILNAVLAVESYADSSALAAALAIAPPSR